VAEVEEQSQAVTRRDLAALTAEIAALRAESRELQGKVRTESDQQAEPDQPDPNRLAP
jgi:hypothetical protein